MNELSYQDCIPLIEVLQKSVRIDGILRAVIAFGEADSAPVNLSARSIGEGMTNGKDLQTSFRDAVPRLPDMIVRILENGVLNSVLDYALDDILLLDRRSSEEPFECLLSLARKYECISNSQVCSECFERDFNKLLARAETENAFEVILEQDGESFLHQKFISSRLIHVIEPTHSLVYRTFWARLNSVCANGGLLETSDQAFRVTQENPFSFLLTVNGEDILKIVFKEQKVLMESDKACSGKKMIGRVVSEQTERYPMMQIQDLYKLVYQGVMGSGHAVSSVAAAEKWLGDELLFMGECQAAEEVVERLSPDILRVNLRPFAAFGGDTGVLLDAFIRTGREYSGNADDLIRLWKIAAEVQNLFSLSEMDSYFSRQEEAGFPAVHHSQVYRELYRPAYRVVAENIFRVTGYTFQDD